MSKNRTGLRYTKEEVEYLKANAGKVSHTYIATRFGRTPNAIKLKILDIAAELIFEGSDIDVICADFCVNKLDLLEMYTFEKKSIDFESSSAAAASSSSGASVIYILECEDNCYYIGSTTNLNRRWEEHKSGNGSVWTKLHLAKKIIDSFPGEAVDENSQVIKYMIKYGMEYVRGGTYSNENLMNSQKETLIREIRHAKGTCLKCGRSGHMAKNCYAKTELSE